MRTCIRRARANEVRQEIAEVESEDEGETEGAQDVNGTGQGPEDEAEMDELMAAAAAGTRRGNDDTELEIDEWEEAMAREADDEDWWREPNRIDDG